MRREESEGVSDCFLCSLSIKMMYVLLLESKEGFQRPKKRINF